MAKVFPDGWRELTATDAAERELQTLARLAAGFDHNYTVYHGVHWTHIERGSYAILGEIDFAIVGPTGKILLIEQKAGLLSETPGGLAKKYLEKEKSVPSQMARSADALHRRLRQFCKDQTTFVDSLIYCPDPFASKLAPTLLSPQPSPANCSAGKPHEGWTPCAPMRGARPG